MAEYVSRETLLKAVEKMDRLDKEGTPYEYDKEGYILLIESAPNADVEEVKRGKWLDNYEKITTLGGNGVPKEYLCGYKCSLCGRTEIGKEPYCNCGAKMDGGNAGLFIF